MGNSSAFLSMNIVYDEEVTALQTDLWIQCFIQSVRLSGNFTTDSNPYMEE